MNPADTLATSLVAGDRRSLARAISLVEDQSPLAPHLMRHVYSRTGRAHIVGVTGPPGAGKSTIVDGLVKTIRAAGRTVGVLAIDPTSPFSGGAVLGDRVRMTGHSSDAGVFVRSMATRGQLGGLARATSDAALLLDAAGFDTILIETVGVGQDEVDVVRAADASVVVLVPGAGDEVQAIKAGIMEIADVFVVNKADRGGADQFVQTIRSAQALGERSGERPQVITAVATTGQGIAELWDLLEQKRAAAVAGRRGRLRAAEAPVLEALPWNLGIVRFQVGSLRVSVLHDGLFRLDGGAMFGVVPRALWERKTPADARHRIQLAMRPALVEGDWGRLLIDCGAGDKWSEKERDIYAFDRRCTLDHALADVGLSSEDIPLVVPTHLHFDHFGGATVRDTDGVRPRFPRARHLIRRDEWHDATHAHERNRASYLLEDFEPLHAAGVVDFFDDDHAVRPGVRIVRTGGHTGQHQVIYLESEGQTAVFTADLIPTTAHIQDPWIMGYDLFPMDTLRVKRQLIRDAIDHGHVVIFEHDPLVAAGYIRERDGRRFVEPLRYTN